MPRIHRIATGVPQHSYEQSEIRDWMLARLGSEDRRSHKLIQLVYDRSGIATRHSALPDFQAAPSANSTAGNALGLRPQDDVPSTGERNERYIAECRELAPRVAAELFAGEDFQVSEVTHLVTVSCTGFSAPGIDLQLIDALGLDPSVKRTHIGFMGCCAAFPALRTASDICRAHAAEPCLVLVVCIELCTLHLKPGTRPDQLLSASLFADGCAAALVSSRAPSGDAPVLELDHFATAVVPDTAGDMAWSIGDEGFDMVLSSYVPRVLGASIRELLATNLELPLDEIRHWAVHPGGRAIVDHVQDGLDLPDAAMRHSRAVLREFGNMSSATILFVLARLLAARPEPGSVAALAFGPGLTVEVARFSISSPCAAE